MKLFSLFTDKAPNKVFFSIVLGAMAGICYSFLIPLVLNSIGDNGYGETAAIKEAHQFLGFEVSNYNFAALFITACAFILVFRTLSQILLIQVAMDISTELRQKIYQHIIKAPIAELDKMGPSRLIATITADVARIVGGARVLPDILISSVTVLGLLGFLSYLNPKVFWFVIVAIVIGALTYQLPMYLGNHFFAKGRFHIDGLHESIRGLIYGTKELKLNNQKREFFFKEFLLKSESDLIKSEKTGHSIVTAGMAYGDLIGFLVIAVVSFIFISYQSISTEELIGVIMALLYITGPMGMILNSIPQISIAKISLNSVKRLLDDIPEELIEMSTNKLDNNWQSIVFKDVSYQYESGDEAFSLGPVDLTINRGEITFIVGGNGSGKSTLSKLLALHYSPTQGHIEFGGLKVDATSINSCRQVISAIFTDYYLFQSLLGVVDEKDREMVQTHLKELGLDKKVKLENGTFSTITLSDGQKKRLALLVSFLEDRDLYIFDEWAADQDPVFKSVFYHTILPDLKAQGKAVVVISHDDRFFGIADQVIVMAEGEVVEFEHSIFSGQQFAPITTGKTTAQITQPEAA
jgi:putative ATP-binding cassette transporter